jgi:hypothetical protein
MEKEFFLKIYLILLGFFYLHQCFKIYERLRVGIKNNCDSVMGFYKMITEIKCQVSHHEKKKQMVDFLFFFEFFFFAP